MIFRSGWSEILDPASQRLYYVTLLALSLMFSHLVVSGELGHATNNLDKTFRLRQHAAAATTLNLQRSTGRSPMTSERACRGPWRRLCIPAVLQKRGRFLLAEHV